MADEVEAKFPTKALKFIFLGVLFIGITLYVSWMILFLIPAGTWFDVGIFSLSICIAGFGAAGFWLYSNVEKKELQEQKAKASEKKGARSK